jgi:hypothetical protein
MQVEIEKDHAIRWQLDEMDAAHANGLLKTELIGFANGGKDVFYRFTWPDQVPTSEPMERWFLRRMYRGTDVAGPTYKHRMHLLPWPEKADSAIALVTRLEAE